MGRFFSVSLILQKSALWSECAFDLRRTPLEMPRSEQWMRVCPRGQNSG